MKNFWSLKNLRSFAVGVIALICTSCGKSDNVYPVSGTVTYNGKPATGATVFFHRQGGAQENEHAIMGIVKEDGTFTLVHGPHAKGAPAGEYDVLIEWKQNVGQSQGRPQKGQDQLAGRYADPASPRLFAVVKASSNQLPPFELTD